MAKLCYKVGDIRQTGYGKYTDFWGVRPIIEDTDVAEHNSAPSLILNCSIEGTDSAASNPISYVVLSCIHVLNNIYNCSNTGELIWLQHQAPFSPPVSTLLKAARLRYPQGWLQMMVRNRRRHIHSVWATPVYHLRQSPQGISSIRQQNNTVLDNEVKIATDNKDGAFSPTQELGNKHTHDIFFTIQEGQNFQQLNKTFDRLFVSRQQTSCDNLFVRSERQTFDSNQELYVSWTTWSIQEGLWASHGMQIQAKITQAQQRNVTGSWIFSGGGTNRVPVCSTAYA